MTTKRFTTRAAAGFVLAAAAGGQALALPPTPKPEEMAAAQPKYPGVAVTTPTPAELARCTVQPVPNAQNPQAPPIGHVLLDGNNRMVRRFLAVGTANYNIMSYYLDGKEVFRETDANGNGKPDQFRWLGTAGGKWGLDPQETGRVTSWAKISPEEVSKELFDAVVEKDPKRLDALLPTDEELKSLGLPADEVAKVKQRTAGAAARLAQTAQALALSPKAKWIHVELWTPQTTPADAFGGTQDVVRHRNGGVLVDKGDQAPVFFQTGELVQIGNGWRLIDGPAVGSPSPDGPADASEGATIPDAIKPLVEQLSKLKVPDDAAGGVKYQADRAAILEQIVTKLQNQPQQEAWLKQLLEAYANAAEGGAKDAGERLTAWKKTIEQTAPKSAVAGFVGFRSLAVDYGTKMKAADTPANVAKVQTWWKEQLEAFVKDFPAGEETPEALFRLGMAHEFSGKDGEAAAKQWYASLAKNFATHQLAPQAQGAVKRLDSEGQAFTLVGGTLAGTGLVDVAGMKGKVVVVYYWASWSRQLNTDAVALAEVAKKFAAKGVEIVTVNMDADPTQAVKAINAAQLPGTHLFEPNGKLAAAYGVMGPHLFVVGKDGKVANKNGQISLLADEVEKLTK